MYEELAKRLRYCAISDNQCSECKYRGGSPDGSKMCLDVLMENAADAIEELQKQVLEWQKSRDLERSLCAALEQQIPRWIPVTERLPEDNETVNVVWVNHSPVIYYQHIKGKPQTATGVYYRGKWYWWSAVVQDYLAEYGEWEPDLMDAAIEVTHWMPLPEPPKEEA